MHRTAVEYENEPVRYPALEIISVLTEGQAVTERYRNMVLNVVNDSCLRLSVFNEQYQWHQHPTSDECFLVVDGCLVIELGDGRVLRLQPWQCVTIPAGMVHRTRAEGRTVNLCFEKLAAKTIFTE